MCHNGMWCLMLVLFMKQRLYMILLAGGLWFGMMAINAYSEEPIFALRGPEAKKEAPPKKVTRGNSYLNASSVYFTCKDYFRHQFNTKELMSRKSTCTGYFYGIGSVLKLLQKQDVGLLFCLPDDLSTTDMIEAFNSWAGKNRKLRIEYAATVAVMEALKEAYPCLKPRRASKKE